VEHPLILSDPAVMMGKPVIAGTRITVDLILEKMASGETIEQILEAHPRLTRGGILAALDYATRVLRSDVVYPIARQSA
jgi:uncharacterized protein (DUF433 family)